MKPKGLNFEGSAARGRLHLPEGRLHALFVPLGTDLPTVATLSCEDQEFRDELRIHSLAD